MRNVETESFDFDEWASLAKLAPEKFEQRRSECITSLIANSGRKDKCLLGLQYHIDMERTRAHTAMKSCLKISSLMLDTFFDFLMPVKKCYVKILEIFYSNCSHHISRMPRFSLSKVKGNASYQR